MKPPRPAPSDDQHRRHPLATSTSTPTERHASPSDQHVRRWRRLNVEGRVRHTVKRLAERGWLTEPVPGRFMLADGPAAGS